MDSTVEGRRSISRINLAIRRLRLLAIATLAATVTACGGGGGGGGGGNNPETGSLEVTVVDTIGTLIADADVEATSGSSSDSGTTDANGVALLTNINVGTASVTVSRANFDTKTVTSPAITANATTQMTVTLDRATSAAGGSLASRGNAPVVSNGGQTLTFEIEVVVVDASSQPITTLTAADFALAVCPPDPNTAIFDCIRTSGGDVGYDPTTPTAQNAQLIQGQNPQPYAAALMIDQSQSISQSDKTGARLFSARAFLEGLGGGDRALLAAFANDLQTTAQIPTKPLTVYPPFRDSGTIEDDPSYFDTLAELQGQVGGGTPLYESLDLLVDQVRDDATLPAGIAKAVVVFTDGEDSDCGSPGSTNCRNRRATSIDNANPAGTADDLRVFTIGLSAAVDFEALAELANDTGGAFLFASSADQLIPLYGTVGDLLSLSLPTYRLTFAVDADQANVFLSGNALRGTITVSAAGTQFDVPFLVGIP